MKDETDAETGEQYQLTHDDFVEAAQRCLAIEEEMYVTYNSCLKKSYEIISRVS